MTRSPLSRSLAVGTLACCGFVAAGEARSDMVSDVWLKLGEHCAPVIEKKTVDPEDFKSLPAEHRIASSTDGRRIQVDHQTQDQQWSVSASQSDVGGKRYIYCTVAYHNFQQLADVAQISENLIAMLKASGATDIAGGPQQDIQITPLYATPGSGIDQSVEFDVVGLQPWPDVLVQFQVFTYGMGIGVLTDFPLSEVE